jgi:4-hydroxythreonine-4-phosphate dehydrogenase
MDKPKIGIPLGDPAGIGPEIVARALCEASIFEVCRPVVIGDGAVLEQAARFCGLNLEIHAISDPDSGDYRCGSAHIIDLGNVDLSTLKIGQIQPMGGQAAFDYIKKATDLAKSGAVDAIATTPINKESLRAAQIDFIGHTEILAGLNLRVFFLSRHVSLRQACDMVTKQRVLDYIIRCSAALAKLGVSGGAIAVAGLNPHSGEHGLFGDEEVRHVMPAVREAQSLGYAVEGPIGADSVFHLALSGRYDAVLSLYHDQGHIATKTLDFERTIAITIGLPFLRTSVDHGTAMDIAGTGVAGAVSMIEAILLAAKYARRYNSDGLV